MRHLRSLRTPFGAGFGTGVALCLMLASLAARATPAGDGPTPGAERFRTAGRVVDGAADWIALGTDLAAFGSGTAVTVTGEPFGLPLHSRISLHAPATGGALAGDRLYLVERHEGTDRLVVLHLDTPGTAARPVGLEPAPRGRLRIARMDDHLLVAEDGLGLRILRLPHPGHARHGVASHGSVTEPARVGLVPIEGTIRAIATSMRRILVAVDRRLLVLDATVPSLPGLAGELPLGVRVEALAANGPTVYVLAAEGLRVLSLGGAAPGEVHAVPPGRAMALAGRSLLVAGGGDGLREVVDARLGGVTHFVTVGDLFFDPAGTINVASGDTVQWDKPTTAFPHNVFSCNAGQIGCGGETSTETFSSGGVTTSPFSFSHTFTLAGPNRYLCQAHTGSMQGNVMVAGGAAAPPAVPDGDGGTAPMTVGKLDAAGDDLSIAFDTSCPDAAGIDLLFGAGSGLPSVLGGTYALGGGECGVGLASPFTWAATPSPPPGTLLWWVLVADDGTDTEGSWGKDSAGGERTGPGADGASQECGNTDKTLDNACGQ